MQMVSVILMVIHVAMLNCSFNKIFDGFQIRTELQKNNFQNIIKRDQGKSWNFIWKWGKSYRISEFVITA